MMETEQGMHTRVWGSLTKSLHSTSRIDRVYASTPAGWAHLQESFCDMLPWTGGSDHYPVRFGAKRKREAQDPQTPTLPQWIANHIFFAGRVKYHFKNLDAEGATLGKVERPWSRLDRFREPSGVRLRTSRTPVRLRRQRRLTHCRFVLHWQG